MTTDGSRQPGRSPWPARIGLIVLLLLVACAVVVYSTIQMGVISGEEFSPTTFKRRSFTYYEIPLIGIQVSPIWHKDQSSDLERFLVSDSLVPAAKGADPKGVRWDLVYARRGEVVSHRGDAQILCNYFDARDRNEEETWLTWTKKHQELASILWPVIRDLANQELYIFIPQLMEIAERTPSTSQFSDLISQTLTTRLLELATNQRFLDRHAQAIELYTQALTRSPNEIEALQGRAESLRILGKQQESAADQALIRELQGSIH